MVWATKTVVRIVSCDLSRPGVEVAPLLLGTILTSDIGGRRVSVRVVEVEAYGGPGEDPASHAHHGMTPRNTSMFGPPGTCYIYRSYGIHWCLNVTIGPVGHAAAVLLRAGQVVAGFDVARERRLPPSGRPSLARDLARGPGRLTQALGVTGSLDGSDLLDPGNPLRLTSLDEPATEYLRGPRVGISRAADRPWRFWLPDEPTVSAYREGAVTRREGSER